MNNASGRSTNAPGTQPPQRRQQRPGSDDVARAERRAVTRERLRARLRRDQQEDEEVHEEILNEMPLPPVSNLTRYRGPPVGLWDTREPWRLSRQPRLLTNGGGSPPPSAQANARAQSTTDSSLKTSSSTSTATPSKQPFERRLEDVKLSKTDLNTVIMDYLISEGYPSAAQKFASEANIQPTSGVDSIQERVEIREAIYAGDIQTAIERINELNPLLLERDNALHFALLRLQLVELIRNCTAQPNDDATPALDFAQAQLAPRAPTNPQFLEDLERTMTLLIFDRKDLPPQLATLLEPKLRKDVAQKVNEALLKEQGERTKAKLYDLVRLRAWSEQKAREAKKDLPEHLGLGLEGMGNGRGKEREEGVHSNGEGEAMVA
ncbi:MAG: hypothetical protein Q9225_000188 [Loekoesia sp. 1 TL-2023]